MGVLVIIFGFSRVRSQFGSSLRGTDLDMGRGPSWSQHEAELLDAALAVGQSARQIAKTRGWAYSTVKKADEASEASVVVDEVAATDDEVAATEDEVAATDDEDADVDEALEDEERFPMPDEIGETDESGMYSEATIE